MLDPFGLRSGQAVERWAFAFCVQPINHQPSTINNQLLSLAADLELIEKRVVLFAIPIEDSYTFYLSAASQLSSRQFDYVLVFHGLNLEIVSVRSGQGHGYRNSRVDKGHARIGFVSAGAIVNLVIRFALVISEFEDSIFIIIRDGRVGVAGPQNKADRAGRGIVLVEFLLKRAVLHHEGEGVTSRKRLFKRAISDGLLKPGTIDEKPKRLVALSDSIQVGMVFCVGHEKSGVSIAVVALGGEGPIAETAAAVFAVVPITAIGGLTGVIFADDGGFREHCWNA